MKTKEEYNAYMKEYMLERYKKRRATALERLGNKSVRCDATDNLELDHIDPKTKSFSISKFSSIAEDKFWLEVEKCQLLCKSCHTLKTINDLGRQNAKEIHGTVSSYRYCKCDPCREAWNKFSREWKRKKRLKKQNIIF